MESNIEAKLSISDVNSQVQTIAEPNKKKKEIDKLTCNKISEFPTGADSLQVSRVKRVVRFCIHVPKHDHTA